MIFTSLTLENFGPYAGQQRLDLVPAHGRPIVLVGGTNGAGKTTILDALTLCLHGRRALGARVAQQAYERHLQGRLHVSVGGAVATRASVTLEFQHAQAGRVSDYSVTRSWRRSRVNIREALAITRDGSPVDDLPASAHQDFLDGLLPPGVAGLFLFDGEKIQMLAEDDSGEQLAEAVQRLLGLDLVQQLRRDLHRYAAVTTGAAADHLGEHVATLEARLGQLESEETALRDQRATLKTRRDHLAARGERAAQRFAADGGALALHRRKLEADARKAAVDLARLEEELRGAISGLLPFAIAPQIASAVAERLESERIDEETELVLARIKALEREINDTLAAPSGRAATALRRILAPQRPRSDHVHDVSSNERALLLAELDRVRVTVPQQAVRLRRSLRRAAERHERAQAQLARVPEEGAVADLLTDMTQIEREVGGVDAEIAAVEEQLKQLRLDTDEATRQLRRLGEEVGVGDAASRATGLALKTATLLEEFAATARNRRLAEIERETARYFNRLSRKGELLAGVTIDPATFLVTVRRWDSTLFPKEHLSAGERQLFAIAVLWALAKASGRELPVVIDTPLARLDREHRRRLLEEYFPAVSHQVVILSTDTEVDVAAAAVLKPMCAREIRLHHDPEVGATMVEAGYFDYEEAASAR